MHIASHAAWSTNPVALSLLTRPPRSVRRAALHLTLLGLVNKGDATGFVDQAVCDDWYQGVALNGFFPKALKQPKNPGGHQNGTVYAFRGNLLVTVQCAYCFTAATPNHNSTPPRGSQEGVHTSGRELF
eukprot:1195711-Prorocentrum_minimum.AAC.4